MVLSRSWNSERPFVFEYVVLTKTLGVRKEKYIRARITRQMDLWERGLHAGLLWDAEVEGAVREGRAASGGEEEEEEVARSYHDNALLGKRRQAIRRVNNREGGGCFLPDDQCTKTGRPVVEILWEKQPDM